jgi:hypothetical protein
MKVLKLCALLLCTYAAAQAQHIKISATQGICYDANKKSDSLFFAKNYHVSQLRVGYHYGKLGVIWNNTYINQVDTKDSLPIDERTPIFVTQAPRKYSNVQTLNSSLGLELCVPIIKHKAQLNFYTTYGLSFSKSDSVVFYDVNLPAYSHQAAKKATGCFQAGFSFNYKFNPHFGIKWQNELDNYKLPYNAVDIRKVPTTFTGTQRKNLLVSSIGVQYTF